MKKEHRSVRACMLAVAVVCAAGFAQASPVWTPNVFATDADFTAYYQGQPTKFETFGAEGRWGNNALNGEYEYNINLLKADRTFQFGAVTGQKQWVSGSQTFRYDWEVEYLGDGTNTVNWTVNGSPTITLNANFGGIETLVLRASTNLPGTPPALVPDSTYTLELNNFSLVDLTDPLNPITYLSPAGSSAIAMSPGATTRIDYFGVSGFDFSTHWKLSGTTNYSWTGSTPNRGTTFNWQIKSMLAVPEPSTLALAACGLGIGAVQLVRRCRRNEA